MSRPKKLVILVVVLVAAAAAVWWALRSGDPTAFAKGKRVDLADFHGPDPTGTCPFRKSYPDVLVVQSSQDRNGDNDARSLDCSMKRRIFL
jgi:hypothetical protein